MDLNVKNAYNIFSKLPLMQYKIIEHLVLHNEDLWKILKYPDSDALLQPNLTTQDKSNMIYPGNGLDANDYRVFMDILSDDAFTKQCSIMKIYPVLISPRNRVVSDVTFCIDILCHSKITQLANYTNRNVYAFQQIMQTLNGSDVNGVGLLAFDRMENSNDKAVMNIANNFNYQGYAIYMSTHTSSVAR